MHDDRSRHINRRGSGHQDDGSRSPGAKQRNAPVGQSLAADLDQGFRLAEAAALPRGQQNSGDARLHTVKATGGRVAGRYAGQFDGAGIRVRITLAVCFRRRICWPSR